LFRSKKRQDEPEEEVLTVDMQHGIVTRNLDGSRVMALGSHG